FLSSNRRSYSVGITPPHQPENVTASERGHPAGGVAVPMVSAGAPRPSSSPTFPPSEVTASARVGPYDKGRRSGDARCPPTVTQPSMALRAVFTTVSRAAWWAGESFTSGPTATAIRYD